jgi:ribosomal protein L7/L12
MNISKLSKETLTKLIEIAIDANPAAVAYIVLADQSTVVDKEPELSEYAIRNTQEIKQAFSNIIGAAGINKVVAVRELRIVSGLSLKEAIDVIHLVFPEYYDTRDTTISADNYWLRALKNYKDTGTVILR